MNRPSLISLAQSLARPVKRGWMPIEIADVVLVRAADAAPDVPDVLGAWRCLQTTLRAGLGPREAAR